VKHKGKKKRKQTHTIRPTLHKITYIPGTCYLGVKTENSPGCLISTGDRKLTVLIGLDISWAQRLMIPIYHQPKGWWYIEPNHD